MGKPNFSEDFRRDTVHPLPDRVMRSMIPKGSEPRPADIGWDGCCRYLDTGRPR